MIIMEDYEGSGLCCWNGVFRFWYSFFFSLCVFIELFKHENNGVFRSIQCAEYWFYSDIYKNLHNLCHLLVHPLSTSLNEMIMHANDYALLMYWIVRIESIESIDDTDYVNSSCHVFASFSRWQIVIKKCAFDI